MRLSHGSLGSVEDVVDQPFTVKERDILAVDSVHALLINNDQMIAPGLSPDIDVFANLNIAFCADNCQPGIAPRRQAIGGEPVNADVAAAAIPTQHHVAEIFQSGMLRMEQIADL